MDSIDTQILNILQTNGRATWAELGEALGVTAPAAAQRVRRLEAQKVIRGFTAIVDPDAAGLGLTAFIAASLERPGNRADFLATITALPEVQELHHLTGEDDYLLKVRCRNVKDLERIVNAEIKVLIGVVRTRTTVVLRTSKESTVLPLNAADEDKTDPPSLPAEKAS